MDLDCAKKRGADNLLDVEAGDFLRACYVTCVT